ncbi:MULTISPECIES: FadR/GntR family transcriptional regulator [Actinomadura]|uniref:FadR/GntR family transcriptional regulator n=1 Tax=Actinomadura yumaensis TaxID=111807 RepID=A0ABW2CFS1_9ACTN|nr:FCD domain-containing protein [Actinomadura sp. J1-007]MWK39830.1 FCD domain-containing protein [Actinomadura sp. J1-007]
MARIESNIPLAARVAEQLRQRIGSGEFTVGTKLPTELQLAQELGVSRNSVREGIRALVHAGMLRARAGDGTYVTASDALAPALRRRATTERAVHVEEVRRLLEREGARLAALRATPEQRVALREAHTARLKAKSGAEYMEADLTFHHVLMEASGNPLLCDLYRGTGGIEESVHRVTPADATYEQFARRRGELDAAHEAVVAAVEAGNDEAAAQAALRSVLLSEELPSVEPPPETPR